MESHSDRRHQFPNNNNPHPAPEAQFFSNLLVNPNKAAATANSIKAVNGAAANGTVTSEQTPSEQKPAVEVEKKQTLFAKPKPKRKARW